MLGTFLIFKFQLIEMLRKNIIIYFYAFSFQNINGAN